MFKVRLADWVPDRVGGEQTLAELAGLALGREAGRVLAASVAGKLYDLGRTVGALPQAEEVAFLTFEDPEGRQVYWHSSAHIMAQAVQRLFPGTKLAIGPAIEEGFYYDFGSPHAFTPADLEAVQAEMERIIASDLPFERREVSPEEARQAFLEREEPYKLELLADLPADEPVSLYRQGEFVDLCRGPHVPSTGKIGTVRLLSVAGAYWRGSETREMLQRIYGISFPESGAMEAYLRRLEEAKRRDHRRLGPQLEIFSLHEEGPGFPFFHWKGMILRQELEDHWRREHRRRGYLEIRTPILLSRELWEQSGHWDHYRENMYFTRIEDRDFCIKPMNCPGAILVYRSRQHSYRELPLRLAELGLVHRHEKSGVLHGLLRVRSFTQDDAHIFLLPSQIKQEILGLLDLIDAFYRHFGFDYFVELSTRPPDAMGSPEVWEEATRALKEALEAKGLGFRVNEGEGAFYGPKIDFHLRDCLGRTWQCGTIQLDFLLPEKFDLTYIGEDGQKHRPAMIHRVVFGSLERFIGILIEHYGGAFPLWLAPVQVKVLPIADRHREWAQKVADRLAEAGARVELDDRNEKIGYKIREAQLEKVPYMLVVGDREAAAGTVSVRHREGGDRGSAALEDFVERFLAEARSGRGDA
ncbi:MAG: threonine--tRNA ligase [Clostridia bacterium]|jgi:threonyl-tRNA synthetase|nr:threonine--tRNA ligase [Clostridia bacterium]MDH7574061.1 threonine--tRNA ligase [Clostridia bacterium]